MAGWRSHEGVALALPIDNIDTDQLIPARFMSALRSEGYGEFLLHDMRRDEHGILDPAFPLNTNRQASVLVAGANFGSGSSREAAVYALVDAGFKAVFAPSFGDIFASNAVNNGLLPACVERANCDALLKHTSTGTCVVRIDLDTCRATFDQKTVSFALEQNWRTKLVNGWDDIDLTQQHAQEIKQFKDHHHRAAPWALPATLD
ncbi:MAG: 3-isopropylmalate dehydratase small subunit [Paracoccaceae bacterium]|nr:3-isopropylmalate dehydratase small subunit [Paracoccaceae bacterium]